MANKERYLNFKKRGSNKKFSCYLIFALKFQTIEKRKFLIKIEIFIHHVMLIIGFREREYADKDSWEISVTMVEINQTKEI